MAEILINGSGLITMCRLCLSRDVTVLDIFYFSAEMKSQLADIIMTCGPVKITKNDGMPNFICELCYTQLEKIHQFQTQVVQSDKTLRRYLQLLGGPDKQTETECPIQPSENPSVYATNANITVKCESLELHDVIDNITKPTNGNSPSSTKSANDTLSKDTYCEIGCEDTTIILDEDMGVNWKDEVPAKFNSADQNKSKVISEFERQADNVLIRSEYFNDTEDDDISVKCEFLELLNSSELLFSTEYCVDNFSKNDSNEFSCEDTKVGFGHMLDEGMDANWEDEEPGINSANKIKREVSSESEHEADNVLIRPEYINDTGNAPFNGNGSGIGCEDTNGDVGHSSENFANLRSADVKYNKREVNNKKTAINPMKRKKRKRVIKKVKKNYNIQTKQVEDSSLRETSELNDNEYLPKNFENQRSTDVVESSHKYQENDKKAKNIVNKIYECNLCNKSYTQLRNLKSHQRIHTSEKPYHCDVCTIEFVKLDYLNKHKRVHTDEKPYQCDVCNRTFSQSSSLRRHKKLHTGKKPYQYDVNKKLLTSSSNVNAHKRTRDGVKPYKCDVCKKCFITSINLNVHKRIHTGKSYKCDVCNERFTQLRFLNNHKNTHTSVQPRKCKICNKRFTNSSNLKTQKRVHTGENPNKCDVCITCFSGLSSLTYWHTYAW